MGGRRRGWLLVAAALAALGTGAGVWYARTRVPALIPSIPNDAEPEPILAESERTLLWEFEHHGNLLNAYGFKRLATALRDADAEALRRCIAEDFAGEVPNAPRETALRNQGLTVVRRDTSPGAVSRVERGPFVEHLLEYRRAFTARPPSVQLVLKTLQPIERASLDGPWRGVALLRLHGEATPGQPCEIVATIRYETVRPSEEALARPGWLRAAGVQSDLTGRAAQVLMPDVAKERGLDAARFHDNWLEDPQTEMSRMISTGGAFVCDFDRDGLLDILITDVKRYALYRGLPNGRFADVLRDLGITATPDNLAPLSGVGGWIDIDGDGWEDLILASHIYRNVEGVKFEDVTRKCNLFLPRDAMGVTVADYDRDGRLDLYVARTGSGSEKSWLEERSSWDAGNVLLRNQGDWHFSDVTRQSGAAGGQRSTFTAAWLDADNDGWPDLHVINEFGNGVLLINQRNGTFRETSLGAGRLDFGSMGVAAGDVDNDGNIDLYCANMFSKAGTRVIGNLKPGTFADDLMNRLQRFVAGSELHLNKGGLKFEQVGQAMNVHAVGWAYGPALADLDNDGWLDIYATAGQISRDRTKPDG